MNKQTPPNQLIKTIVESRQPEAILHIGIGHPEIIEQVCHATAHNPATVITLIQPDLHDNPSHAETLQQLRKNELDTNIEFMSTSADEVLPDLYFQELTFDLAILNPCQDYDQTFVSFYYIDKMLPKNGLVIVPDTDSEIMRKLSRHLITEAGYQVKETVNDKQDMHKIERLIRKQYSRIPSFIRQRVEDIIREDIVVTNQELGLNGSLVVFEKCKEDEPLDQQVDQLMAAMS